MQKKIKITLLPKWEPELNQLKKEQFYNKTQSEMFNYIISCGLDSLSKKTAK